MWKGSWVKLASRVYSWRLFLFIFGSSEGAVHRRIWLGDARCISGMWRPWPGSFAGRYALGVHTVGKDMSCESLQDVARKLATRPRFQTCNVQHDCETWITWESMGIKSDSATSPDCATPLA